MMKSLTAVLAISALSLLSVECRADDDMKIGVWTVELGKKCMISQAWDTEKKGKMGIFIGYLAKGSAVVLGFLDSDSNLKKDEQFNVALDIDKKWKNTVIGVAARSDTVAVVFPATSDALSALKKGNRIDVDHVDKPDSTWWFSLDDTQNALGALEACRQLTE